jgi:hypothetical protein
MTPLPFHRGFTPIEATPMNPSRTQPNRPKRPLSDAQLQARRNNSTKSTGPKTPEGKARSRHNALKHGLTATVCLKPEDQHAVALRLAALEADLRPHGATERLLVRQVAFSSIRLDRLTVEENALRAHRRRHAIERWDAERLGEVQTLIERLYGIADGVAPFSVGRAPEPTDLSKLVQELERTAYGCARLADEWDILAEMMEAEGYWTDTQADRALRLLGHAGPVTPDARREVRHAHYGLLGLRLEEVAGSAGVPPAAAPSGPEARAPRVSSAELRLLEEIDAAFGDGTEHLDPAARLAMARAHLPEPEESRARLLGIARDEAARLARQMHEIWLELDGPDRAEAPDRATAFTDPADQLLFRYRTTATRALNQALSLLVRARSTGLLGLGIEVPESAAALPGATLRGVADAAPAPPDGDGHALAGTAELAPASAPNEVKPAASDAAAGPGGVETPGAPGQTGTSASPETSVDQPARVAASQAAPAAVPAPARNEAKPPRLGLIPGLTGVETVPVSIVPRR